MIRAMEPSWSRQWSLEMAAKEGSSRDTIRAAPLGTGIGSSARSALTIVAAWVR
jgi:hypothetical protein